MIAAPGYALHMSRELERRLALCRASIRTAIRDRLQDITVAAGSSEGPPPKAGLPAARKQPPLHSYAHDGYLVSYQVDPETRRVVVLDLGRAPSAA
jgi:hypothetical protein